MTEKGLIGSQALPKCLAWGDVWTVYTYCFKPIPPPPQQFFVSSKLRCILLSSLLQKLEADKLEQDLKELVGEMKERLTDAAKQHKIKK